MIDGFNKKKKPNPPTQFPYLSLFNPSTPPTTTTTKTDDFTPKTKILNKIK